MTTDLQTGLIPHEDIDAYHAAAALSKTKLDDFLRLPFLFYKKHVERSIAPRKATRDFRVGAGTHALTLEGEEAYTNRFVVTPADAPKDLRQHRNAKKPSDDTVASIKWWDSFEEANKSKLIISPEEDSLNRRLTRAVHEHPLAAALLQNDGRAELTFRVRSKNFFLQCRPDWFGRATPALVELLRKDGIKMDVGEPYGVDLKTAPSLDDLSYRNFSRNFVDHGYHRSGPFYTGVMRDVLTYSVEKFFFVAVEKQEPHSVSVFLPDDRANEIGWHQVAEGLNRLNICYESGIWPDTPRGCQTIKLPSWYTKDFDEAQEGRIFG